FREHLGPWRFHLLLRVQAILVPEHVRGLLGLKRAEWLRPLLRLYPVLVRAGLRGAIQRLLMPPEHLPAGRGLDHPPERSPELRGSPARDTPPAGARGDRPPRGCPFHARSRSRA
ncbi:MAG TPA: hypothetical protein VK399_09145, partial [Longimicrobiaceae bacterium]|nr:hypothetical protein [Longimicrobiaceae bacterium]